MFEFKLHSTKTTHKNHSDISKIDWEKLISIFGRVVVLSRRFWVKSISINRYGLQISYCSVVFLGISKLITCANGFTDFFIISFGNLRIVLCCILRFRYKYVGGHFYRSECFTIARSMSLNTLVSKQFTVD